VGEAQAAVQIAQAQKAQAEAQRVAAAAQAESAAAAVRQAQAQVELVKAGATASDLQRAQAAITRAEAAVQAARLAADEAVVRAPITGTISRLDARLGGRLMPGSPVALLADLAVWEVETKDLTELEVVKITPGQAVTIIPDALPELELSGVVVAIRQVYEEKLGDVTYTTRVRLEESDPRLLWGMTVSVNVPNP
jgi:multidrug resistance efflux pump